MVLSAEWSSWALKSSWCGWEWVFCFLYLAQVAGGTEPRVLPLLRMALSTVPELAALSGRAVPPCILCGDSPHPGEPQRPCRIGLLAAARGAVSLTLVCPVSLQGGPFLSQPASCQHSLQSFLPQVGTVLEGQGGVCPEAEVPRPGPTDLALHPEPPLRVCTGGLSRMTLRFQVSRGQGW